MESPKTFSEFTNEGNLLPPGVMKTFYKIVDKSTVERWLKKDFIPDKKTIVTANRKEVDEINPEKTAVELRVPSEAVIDNEGSWFILDIFPFRNKIQTKLVAGL